MKRFLAAIIFIISCLQVTFLQAQSTVDEIIAIIGKEIIMRSDLEAEYANYAAQFNTMDNEEEARCLIFEQLVKQKLYQHQAEVDSIVISDQEVDARVTYQINGGNSALYFRAAEEDIPWVLKGFQNEIAGNNKDSALWHTQGKTTKGRGWVSANDELVEKVRNTSGWNTVSTIAIGDRIVNRLNGFETFDITDPICEKTGKLGLQLHGGADNEMRFKDWEVMPVEAWMLDAMKR